MSKHRFPYRWNLADGYPPSNCLKVFGTFICGGGSTMGYKLAGFEHLGGVEIDPPIADVYRTNHKPLHLYNEDIRVFNGRDNLPPELYDLDILDGSPPCSSFSMAGSREKAWGKEKQFREGQAVQTLDDLVFVYCETIKKLLPKVFLLENVKGIIQGNAKSYSKKIVQTMTAAGYTVQVFLLNAASMGVPQKRERVFFIGYRKELGFKPLKLAFNEDAIPFSMVDKGQALRVPLSETYKAKWNETPNGSNPKAKSGNTFGFMYRVSPIEVVSTITSGGTNAHHETPHELTDNEYKLIGTYPLDYNFKRIEPKYLIGMSVPPVMTAQIASQIAFQWFGVPLTQTPK